MRRVVPWDFDGTLAHRPGMWSGCLLETLDEHQPGHRFDRDWSTVGLYDIVEDALIAACWLLPLDQRTFDEIWSG
jgi:hypothetical protein